MVDSSSKGSKNNREGRLCLPSSKTAPGVVGGSVEDLELNGDIATGTAAGRIEHMARNGTTGGHDVCVRCVE